MGKKKQHIDDFLLGRLTKKEANDFQKEMQNDPELEKDVHFHEDMIKGLQAFGNKELKNRLQEMHSQMVKEEKKSAIAVVHQNKLEPDIGKNKSSSLFKVKSLPGVLAMVAGFLLLILGIYWIFISNTSTEDLYAVYFEPYRVSFAARSNVNKEELTLAGTYYFEGKYREGLPLLKSVSQQIPNDLDVQLALATTYLELSQIPEAQQLFRQIIADANPLYHEQAYWFFGIELYKTKAVC